MNLTKKEKERIAKGIKEWSKPDAMKMVNNAIEKTLKRIKDKEKLKRDH